MMSSFRPVTSAMVMRCGRHRRIARQFGCPVYCLIPECSRTGRALPHQNAPGAAMLCQAASGRNARLRRLVIHGSGAAGCVMVDTAEHRRGANYVRQQTDAGEHFR